MQSRPCKFKSQCLQTTSNFSIAANYIKVEVHYICVNTSNIERELYLRVIVIVIGIREGTGMGMVMIELILEEIAMAMAMPMAMPMAMETVK